MSRIHVFFVKCEQTSDSVVYRVQSPDFSDDQFIGEIRFDVLAGSYQFIPMGSLMGKSVIPPYVFDLPEEQQEQIIKRNYSDCSYGGWTSRIARMAKKLQDKGEFPNEFYGIT